MTQNLQYHFKFKKKEHSQKILDQSKVRNKLCKLWIPCLISKCSSHPQFLSSLLTSKQFFLFSFLHSLLAVLLGSYSTALASSISWSNTVFSFGVWHNGSSKSPCTDIPDIILALADICSYREWCHKLFFNPWLSMPEPHGWTFQVILHARASAPS